MTGRNSTGSPSPVCFLPTTRVFTHCREPCPALRSPNRPAPAKTWKTTLPSGKGGASSHHRRPKFRTCLAPASPHSPWQRHRAESTPLVGANHSRAPGRLRFARARSLAPAFHTPQGRWGHAPFVPAWHGRRWVGPGWARECPGRLPPRGRRGRRTCSQALRFVRRAGWEEPQAGGGGWVGAGTLHLAPPRVVNWKEV